MKDQNIYLSTHTNHNQNIEKTSIIQEKRQCFHVLSGGPRLRPYVGETISLMVMVTTVIVMMVVMVIVMMMIVMVMKMLMIQIL